MRAARAARRLHLAVRLAVLAGLVMPLAGCGITHLQDLNFRVDDRLHFTSPKDRSRVHAPVALTWRIRGFRSAALGSEPPSHDAGYFAVFVDQQPIKPGQTVKALAADRFCKQDPKCPDVTYLNNRGVYLTTTPSVRIDQVVNLTATHDKVQQHTFVVVLMDTAGHRIGESAWELDLRIPKIGL